MPYNALHVPFCHYWLFKVHVCDGGLKLYSCLIQVPLAQNNLTIEQFKHYTLCFILKKEQTHPNLFINSERHFLNLSNTLNFHCIKQAAIKPRRRKVNKTQQAVVDSTWREEERGEEEKRLRKRKSLCFF